MTSQEAERVDIELGVLHERIRIVEEHTQRTNDRIVMLENRGLHHHETMRKVLDVLRACTAAVELLNADREVRTK